jgi:hypothetical protein
MVVDVSPGRGKLGISRRPNAFWVEIVAKVKDKWTVDASTIICHFVSDFFLHCNARGLVVTPVTDGWES